MSSRSLRPASAPDSKWIEGLTPEMPPHEAARLILDARLGTVDAELQGVAAAVAADTEPVHRLRVATRRAAAAVRTLKACVPERELRLIRKCLRRIRRAAGPARDWDVFLLDLHERRAGQSVSQSAGFDFLLGFGSAHRLAAQPALAEILNTYATDFGLYRSEVVLALRPTVEVARFVEMARPQLAMLILRLEEAASADLTDYANLHQVRIAGKQLRYAVELFAGCFAPSLREELYPRIEQLQSLLGNANDSHLASQRLLELRTTLRQRQPAEWKRLRVGFERVARFHTRRLALERKRFEAWWKRWTTDGLPLLEATLAQKTG